MKYKKSIIMLALAIFILGAAGVCASDVNDTAIADAGQMELSASNEMNADTLGTSEENTLTQANDCEILGEGESGTFTQLQNEINDAGNELNLTMDYRWTDEFSGTGIVINNPITINGNGHSIDALGKIRIFELKATTGVTLNNITFKNGNTGGYGGAINVWNALSDSKFTNLNFINNTAAGNGGALYMAGASTNNLFENITFENNTDNKNGGALYVTGASTSDTFENVKFVNNTAKNNDGGAVNFHAKVDGATFINVSFFNNRAEKKIGGAINFDNGLVNSVFNNTCFMDNSAMSGGALGITGTISSLTFENTKFIHNTALIQDGGAINIGPYAHSDLANTTFKKVSFINNVANRDGGALFVTKDAKSNAFEDVEFINNVAKGRNGGAIRFGANTYQFITQGNSFKMVTFANNTANNNGGALYVTGGFLSNVLELIVFENNTAKTMDGGAINFYKTVNDTTFNEVIFYKNSALQSRSGAVNCDNGMENSIFNNTIFKENSALITSAITLSGTTSSNTFKNTQFLNNTASYYLMYVNNATSGNIIRDSIFLNNNASKITVKNGNINMTDDWFGNNATCYDENPNVNQTLDNWLFLNATVSPAAITLDQNSTIEFKFYSYDNKTKAVREYDGSASVPLGLYSTLGLLNRPVALINETIVYTPSKDGNGTVTGKYETAYYTVVIQNSKVPTEIAAADVSTVYNVDKYLIITLKDENGNPLSGVDVTVDLNGAKTYATDDNGQVKVSTEGLVPNAYVAKITFGGDAKYGNSSKDVVVTVKKATPKIVAKSKTFKTTTKTKKYTITLKDNTGKPIKKAKVTLKVKGKTYKATTNSKGKATFRIKKLKKVGTFKAVIKFNANKYYNKVSKKVKIKVIFKTVSKGSKDKSTVKKIQKALKSHGYYLTYKGHYLKVDGKFKSCTKRSVKQFQRDNGLKVTGKVDEKTAKKLGII